jgi:recombinational DNA repair ATPase RecF
MKIIELRAENVKRLKAIEINPDEFFQVIGGRNSQGKTSVIDAIWLAFSGKSASQEIDKPIRHGEDHAFVELNLGDLIVTRTWKGDTSTLKVEAAGGAKYPAPQEMLNKLLGKLAFDPLEFTRLEPKMQREALLAIAPLEIDLKELEAKRAQAYLDRTDIGRVVNALEGQLQGLGKSEEAPKDAISVAELVKQFTDAQELENNYNKAVENRNYLIARKSELEQELKETTEKIQAQLKRLDDMPPLVDLESLRSEIDNAEETNNKVRRNQQRAEVAGKLKSASEERETKSSIIQALENDKTMALAKAKFPVEGLSFTDEGVTFNDIPFGQLSDSEKIRISLLMGMALNPDIRVIIVREGSLLDSDNMALVSQMAHDKDYQIFIERVGNADESAIIIEDGLVQA